MDKLMDVMMDVCFSYNKDLKPSGGHAAIYARESVDSPMLKKQVDEVITKAEAIGESTYTVYSEVSIDEGGNQPEFTRLMTDIVDGKISRVYVKHWNRITRDLEKLTDVLEKIREYGIQILSIDGLHNI